MRQPRFWCLYLVTCAVLAFPSMLAAEATTTWKFDFGPGTAEAGYTKVAADAQYTRERGFGFEPGATVVGLLRNGPDAPRSSICTSQQPFLFSVHLPEGNYTVTVTLGDSEAESATTVKSESRRLMLEHVPTRAGEFITRTFTVNIRTPDIDGRERVKLNDEERDLLHWDDKLTLEFNGKRPSVAAIEIEKATDAVTVFLLGDSTVTDLPLEPWGTWGQMLPRFFKSNVAVANHAESGESLESSLAGGRVTKVLNSLKPGDYLFVQFGHNDQKSRDPMALEKYRANLVSLVAEVRKRNAHPVLITSLERMGGATRDTLGQYPQTVRDVAIETKTPVIDLNAQSKRLYAALGAKLRSAFQDASHHNSFGGYEMARCVVEGIKSNKLDLANLLSEDLAAFDPDHPDRPEEFAVPASPTSSSVKPEGS